MSFIQRCFFKRFILLFVLLAPYYSYGQVFKVLKLLNDDSFVVAKNKNTTPGAKIYIYNRETLQGHGKIVRCKKTACMAKITQKNENFNFQLSMLISYNAEKPKKEIERGVYGGVGGTLGFGTLIGYWINQSKDIRLEAAFEYLSVVLADIGVDGIGFNVGGQYTLYRYGDFYLPAFMHVSVTNTSIDFSKLYNESYKTDAEIIFSLEFGGSLAYAINDKLSVSGGLGLSYNTISRNYSNSSTNTQYTVPFSGMFLVGNIYASYGF